MQNVSKVIVLVVIVSLLGYGVYYAYTEYEALRSLEFEVYDVDVSRFRLTDADVEVNLRFYNPTGRDTPLFQGEFDVYLSNRYIGHGKIPEMGVPSGFSKTQNITFTIIYANATKAIFDALRSGSFNLTAHGTIQAKILFGAIPVSFPFQRQIQLRSEIQYGDITVEQARRLTETNPFLVILDVRTGSEFEGGHIIGAINIPVDELQSRIGTLNSNDEILVYCRTGIRSSRAMKILADNGFLRVYNMLGGIEAWIEANYSIEK